MAKKIYKCKFSSVNGQNTGVFLRTGTSNRYPSPGILYKKNCPDNLHFYADPDVGGVNNYYQLINPKEYKINHDGVVYVWLSKSYLLGWELIDDPNAAPEPTPPPPPPEPPRPTLIPKEVEKGNNDYLDFGKTNDNGVIYNTQGTLLNEEVIYKSYTKVTRNTYLNDYSTLIKDIDTIERNLNIGMNANMVADIKNNMLTKFNRFAVAFPDLALTKTFAHVFFTRPNLNLYKSGTNTLLSTVENDPYFYYLHRNSPQLLKSLTKDFNSSHDFNPYLSNMAGSFELSDEYIDTNEYGETYTGWKVKYGRHNIKSKTADSFSINYTDDNNYNVYKIHKAWTDYISKVYRGEFPVDRTSVTTHTLDYAASVYYFLCAADGETILFWTKYTGVFPTNTPSSASSMTKGQLLKMPEFSIKYEYSWKEDMVPTSLAEFNLNSAKQSTYKYANIYEPDILSTGKTFVNAPFVQTVIDKNTGKYEFKLRFRN